MFVAGLGLWTGAAGCGGSDSHTKKPSDCVTLADGSCVTETFENPPVLQPDGNGVYQLQFEPVEFSFDGKRQCGRGYNGHYPAPTIDIAAQKDGQARHVRVDVKNTFTKMDMKALEDDGCACSDTKTGKSCMPSHDDPSSTCACTNDAGESCMIFDFNETNLHFHGAHTRPDFAAGGGCTAKNGLRCRTCEDDPNQGTADC
ncbi:MAG TPA: hypothetical protein VHB21_00350 [Minicystis sp.]|nr:hypothetical protein [Minicystis sp.]